MLCLGGSFNPIHHGHLICGMSAAEQCGIDHLMLIPAGTPPHKLTDRSIASADHRLRMCSLAAAETGLRKAPLMEVSDLELWLPAPSYTLNTARALRTELGVDAINWLIGADMLNSLPGWHLAETLIEEVNFIIMARAGFSFEWSSLPPAFRKLQKNVVETPLIQISATNIRQRVREDRSIDFLTPSAVVRYIAEHRLYRD